jgi:drug/metabolite transporter (DMT)-like permease
MAYFFLGERLTFWQAIGSIIIIIGITVITLSKKNNTASS